MCNRTFILLNIDSQILTYYSTKKNPPQIYPKDLCFGGAYRHRPTELNTASVVRTRTKSLISTTTEIKVLEGFKHDQPGQNSIPPAPLYSLYIVNLVYFFRSGRLRSPL